MKILIKGGSIITMDTKYPKVFKGDIAIEGKKIIFVNDVPEDFYPEKIINAENHIYFPVL